MDRSFLPACVGALAVIAASVAIAAGPVDSFCPVTDSTLSSVLVSSEMVAPALVEPAPAAPSTEGVTFTRIEGAEVQALLGAEWTPEGEALRAPMGLRGTPIECIDLTISFAEDPTTGISAIMTIRGNDLDGNGKIEAEGDAGFYNLYLGADEVEQCTLTFYLFGEFAAVQHPVVDGEFQGASFFLFQWNIGSSVVSNLDSGSESGPWVSAGGAVSSFNATVAGDGGFPSYAVPWGSCVCEESVCGVDAEAREGEIDFGFSGAFPSDTTNGGCFSQVHGAGFLSTPIALGDKVCGQSAANEFGRDTDWYAFSLGELTTMTVRVRSSFNMQVLVLDLSMGGCDSPNVLELGVAAACVPLEATFQVYGGEYIVYCAPEFGAQCPPGSEYQLEIIDSTACGHPIYDIDAVAREGEPDCDIPDDAVNGGCNSPAFQTTPIALGDKLRGTTFSTSDEGASHRDTDWYLFTLTRSTVVTYTGKAEFPLQLVVIRGGSPTFCDSSRVKAAANALPCESGTLTIPLAPGAYVAFASSNGGNTPCGSQYQIELTGTPMACPGDINLDGATNTGDFNLFAGNFGEGPDLTWTQGDLTGDGFVDTADFNIMAGNFGCTAP